jgi:hypothetical protein
LGENGTLAKDAAAGAVAAGVFDDLADEVGDFAPVLGGLEASPAGHGGEDDLLGGGEVGGGLALAFPTRFVEGGAVDPGAFEGDTGEEGFRAVDAGPVLGSLDEAFFDALAEDVGETLGLRVGLVGDDDGAVSPSPELLPLLNFEWVAVG